MNEADRTAAIVRRQLRNLIDEGVAEIVMETGPRKLSLPAMRAFASEHDNLSFHRVGKGRYMIKVGEVKS